MFRTDFTLSQRDMLRSIVQKKVFLENSQDYDDVAQEKLSNLAENFANWQDKNELEISLSQRTFKNFVRGKSGKKPQNKTLYAILYFCLFKGWTTISKLEQEHSGAYNAYSLNVKFAAPHFWSIARHDVFSDDFIAIDENSRFEFCFRPQIEDLRYYMRSQRKDVTLESFLNGYEKNTFFIVCLKDIVTEVNYEGVAVVTGLREKENGRQKTELDLIISVATEANEILYIESATVTFDDYYGHSISLNTRPILENSASLVGDSSSASASNSCINSYSTYSDNKYIRKMSEQATFQPVVSLLESAIEELKENPNATIRENSDVRECVDQLIQRAHQVLIENTPQTVLPKREFVNKLPETPDEYFWHAAKDGNLKDIKKYLTAGADVNTIYEHGYEKITAVEAAIRWKNFDAAKLVLNTGKFDLSTLNSRGYTAIRTLHNTPAKFEKYLLLLGLRKLSFFSQFSIGNQPVWLPRELEKIWVHKRHEYRSRNENFWFIKKPSKLNLLK